MEKGKMNIGRKLAVCYSFIVGLFILFIKTYSKSKKEKRKFKKQSVKKKIKIT